MLELGHVFQVIFSFLYFEFNIFILFFVWFITSTNFWLFSLLRSCFFALLAILCLSSVDTMPCVILRIVNTSCMYTRSCYYLLKMDLILNSMMLKKWFDRIPSIIILPFLFLNIILTSLSNLFGIPNDFIASYNLFQKMACLKSMNNI